MQYHSKHPTNYSDKSLNILGVEMGLVMSLDLEGRENRLRELANRLGDEEGQFKREYANLDKRKKRVYQAGFNSGVFEVS